MTWHRGLGEQTWWPWGLQGRSRHWYGMRCDTAPRQGGGRSGRRCDTSGVDQSSHMCSGHWADSPTAACPCCSAGLGMVLHALLPSAFQTTTMCCVESKHGGFSGTDAPLKPGASGLMSNWSNWPWSGAGRGDLSVPADEL